MQDEVKYLSDYKIIKKLGGHKNRKFNDVFLIERKIDGRLFVLKVAATARGIESLRNEANFNFSFQGLPKIEAFIETETEVALILAYKSGDDLKRVFSSLNAKQKLSKSKEIIDLLLPIFNELKQQEIVHLDIKPSNLIYDQEANCLHLIDFGMAIYQNERIRRKLIFPLGYAAPELILNRLNLVDQRTDYFALGISLYQVFTGKLPLLHPNPSITTNLQITHPIPTIDFLTPEANSMLQKCTAKHVFVNSPNQMAAEQVDLCLQEGMNLRYADFHTFAAEWKNATLRKKWLLF